MSMASPSKHSQGSHWSLPRTSHLPSSTAQYLMVVLFLLWWTLLKLPLQLLLSMRPPTVEEGKMLVMIFGLSSQISSTATRNQPFIVVGDFHAQLIDELSSAPGAVGPYFHWENTSEEEMAMKEKGEGESKHFGFFELIFQEDLRVPQTWMQKQHKYRFTHKTRGR